MFLILFSDINCDASGIIIIGLPEKGFIQEFDCVFAESWKTRLEVRCTNYFFEPCFSFARTFPFLYKFYILFYYFF
ncbi:MAG: hypothetical protein PWP57_1168 [Candidatus Atribacteria bacterium]|nr:hypothetical protein [Candidatus Atribacteria bacterium]